MTRAKALRAEGVGSRRIPLAKAQRRKGEKKEDSGFGISEFLPLRLCAFARVIPVLLLFPNAGVATAAPAQMNDVPAQVRDQAPARDYALREVMIPMRDGVKLHTLI